MMNDLFYIKNHTDDLNVISENNRCTVSHLLNDNKLKLISESSFEDAQFIQYLNEFVLNCELKGKYLIGLETSTYSWLVECFQQIAQTRTQYTMTNQIERVLKKLFPIGLSKLKCTI